MSKKSLINMNQDSIVVRSKNIDDLPNVENYIRHKQNYLKKLATKDQLIVAKIRQLPIKYLCKVYQRNECVQLEIGDIIILKNGVYQVFVG